MSRYTLVMYQRPEISSPDEDDAIFSAMMGNLPLAALELGLYAAKRTVEADDLEDLYYRTQHLDPIPDHPMEGLRSLSVGDFAIDEAGIIHHCRSIGWGVVVEEVAERIRALAIPYWAKQA